LCPKTAAARRLGAHDAARRTGMRKCRSLATRPAQPISLGRVQEWRTSRLARYGGAVVALTWSGIVGVDILASDGRSGAWSDWVLHTVLAAALWWLLALRPLVRLDAQRVVVRNPLWTHRLALADVADAVPGYFGVLIPRRARRLPVVAWAVQQANVSEWRGDQTRASDLANRLRDAAHDQR
jgi:hypothetical protein